MSRAVRDIGITGPVPTGPYDLLKRGVMASGVRRIASCSKAVSIGSEADGLITARQLTQCPQSMFPVVDRSQHSRAQ